MSLAYRGGEFALDVLTRTRCFEESILLRGDCQFLMRLRTDDGEVVEICARTLASLLNFIANMAPRQVDVCVGRGENADAIRECLASGHVLH